MMTPLATYETYAPLVQPADLHYRHAKGENLLLVGPKSNPYKMPWIRQQLATFVRLGWNFILLDMSEHSDLGAPCLSGGKWSAVEYNAIANLHTPITVRVLTFSRLLETLDEVHFLKESRNLPHTVVINLGDSRDKTDVEKQVLHNTLERIGAYGSGIWVIADSFQPFQMAKLPGFFHTQITLAGVEKNDELTKWIEQHRMEDVDFNELDADEGYFLFRGRSEGAGRLIEDRLRREDGYAWQPYSI